MAVYPVMWQVECDSCGTTAKGTPGLGMQEVFVASVQQGWVLQVQQADPPTTLLCPTCAARLVAAASADDNGGSATPDEKILEHISGEDS